MSTFALRLLPLALPLLCALPCAHADESASRVAAVPTVAGTSGEHEPAQARPIPDLSVYARYKRALMRGFAAGPNAADGARAEDAAKLDAAPAARLRLAGRPTDGLKLGLTPTRDGGWGVTGAYSRAFGTRRLAMGAPR